MSRQVDSVAPIWHADFHMLCRPPLFKLCLHSILRRPLVIVFYIHNSIAPMLFHRVSTLVAPEPCITYEQVVAPVPWLADTQGCSCCCSVLFEPRLKIINTLPFYKLSVQHDARGSITY